MLAGFVSKSIELEIYVIDIYSLQFIFIQFIVLKSNKKERISQIYKSKNAAHINVIPFHLFYNKIKKSHLSK